jgi:hypothetical protein
VVAYLVALDGRHVREVVSPNGDEGAEPIFYVTEAAGGYILRCALDPPVVGERQGEAETLSSMAAIYNRSGEPREALGHYE